MRIQVIFLAILGILIAGCGENVHNINENNAEVMRQAFARAAQPIERRKLVIDAIDDRLIARGMTITDVTNLFGDKYTDLGWDEASHMRLGVVFFSPVIPPSRPLESAIQSGWYIDFRFGADGRLQYYSLSNLHK